MNPQIVGRSVQHIASLVGLSIPKDRRLIVAEETHVGLKYPFSREKLAPIIAFYTVENWEAACALSIEILKVKVRVIQWAFTQKTKKSFVNLA